MLLTLNATELAQLIKGTFIWAEMPEKGDIVSSNDAESLTTEAAFCGKPWQSVSFPFLIANKESIFFLAPKAYRYYLPAYMLASLNDFHAADTLPDNIIFSITINQNDTDEIKNLRYSRLKTFTFDELVVIVEFLDVLKHSGDIIIEEMNQALKTIQDEMAARNKK